MKIPKTQFPSGQAGLIMMVIITIMAVTVVEGVGTVVIRHRQLTTDVLKSFQSYYTAEAGVEDALTRLLDENVPDPTSTSLSLGGATTTTTVTATGNDYDIVSSSDNDNRDRKVAVSLTRADGIIGNFPTAMSATNGSLTSGNSPDIHGNTLVNGDFTVGTNLDVTGNMIIMGNAVMGNSPKIVGDLSIDGTATIGDNLDITGDTIIDGAANIANSALIVGDMSIDGTAFFGQNTDMTGNLIVNGNTTIDRSGAVVGNISVNGNLAIYRNNTITGNVSATGTITMETGVLITGNVSANNNIVGAGTAQINGVVTVAGGLSQTPTLEWTTNNADANFGTTGSNSDIAQSFSAPATGSLHMASAYLAKVGSPSGSIVAELHADNGDKPATAVLASTTLSAAMISTTAGWINIPFSTPASVTSGTKYWLVINTTTSSATNYWKWRRDSSDGYASYTGKTGTCCSGGATWTNVAGDLAFRVWVGGTPTSLQNVTVGTSSTGSATANNFSGVTVHGSSCLSAYCVAGVPAAIAVSAPANPLTATATEPFNEDDFDAWRDEAVDSTKGGSTCAPPICEENGDYVMGTNGEDTMGPLKIAGNMTLGNSGELTITGTIWVTGNLQINSNCDLALASSYGEYSGVILVDGTVTLNNSCNIAGSGDERSVLLLISTANDLVSPVMHLNANTDGPIFYAPNGLLQLGNSYSTKALFAKKIIMGTNAVVTYDENLNDLLFPDPTTSTTNSAWSIEGWKEVQ